MRVRSVSDTRDTPGPQCFADTDTDQATERGADFPSIAHPNHFYPSTPLIHHLKLLVVVITVLISAVVSASVLIFTGVGLSL